MVVVVFVGGVGIFHCGLLTKCFFIFIFYGVFTILRLYFTLY